MKSKCRLYSKSLIWILTLPVLALAGTALSRDGEQSEHHRKHREKTLYVWAGDQSRLAPDFLAVIDFDEDSPEYGKVIRTVPLSASG
jgi:56kDa selenium binding protein (SBP56)